MPKNKADALDNEHHNQAQILKRTVKDSVFTNLFQDKRYLIQLYRSLHPEDIDVTEDELSDITIKNILTDNIYNDLGFIVGDRMLILAEAQSTWTMNIIVRSLMYLVQTYRDYFERTGQNLYTSRKVHMPIPEIYVIYTGDRRTRPKEISLSQEFFAGEECCIDIRVKMIYDGTDGDIINQYIIFTKVCGEQIALYGRTRQAIIETIRICKDKNILKEYLESREQEVMGIMGVLYDEEEVMLSYLRSEIQEGIQKGLEEAREKAIKEAREKAIKEAREEAIKEAREEAREEAIKEAREKAIEEAREEAAKQAAKQSEDTARKMLLDGTLPMDKIAHFSGLSAEDVERLAAGL